MCKGEEAVEGGEGLLGEFVQSLVAYEAEGYVREDCMGEGKGRKE